MAMNSKRKGNQYERDCVNWLNTVFEDVFPTTIVGMKKSVAHRTPRSGAFATVGGPSKYSGDLMTTISILGRDVKFECKFYKALGIFKFWNKHRKETRLDDIPVLIVHANLEKEHLVVMDRDDWAFLVELAKKGENHGETE
jgi:hypothetical protein